MDAPHAAYVVAAYIASAIGIAAIGIDTLLRARHWRARAERRPDDLAGNDPR